MMLISMKQLVLVVLISSFCTFFLGTLVKSPNIVLSANQIKKITSNVETIIQQHQSTAEIKTSETGLNTVENMTCLSQAQQFPTLKDIKDIFKIEISNLRNDTRNNTHNNTGTVQTISISKNPIYKDEQYQQSLIDSNMMTSKILNNQKLSKEQREKWQRDHSRLTREDKNSIMDKIISAINNQELDLKDPLELPF